MTPIQKAKEIWISIINAYKSNTFFEQWFESKEAAAILSGEDWISVKDRLPDYDKYVLVFGERIGSPQMGGASITIGRRQDLKGTSIAKDANRYQDKNQFSQMAYVTHWMYLPAKPALPEPPKP